MTGIGERLLLTIWVGSLWCVGYVVAPTLFAFLDDRSLAGDIAGELFRIETLLSIGCFTLLVGLWAMAGKASIGRIIVPALMVVMLVVSEWVVGPMISEARSTQGAASSTFAWLHGISATLYLLASVLGVWLVARSGVSSPGE